MLKAPEMENPQLDGHKQTAARSHSLLTGILAVLQAFQSLRGPPTTQSHPLCTAPLTLPLIGQP